MEIYVDGKRVKSIPKLTSDEKLQVATKEMLHFWNTPLKNFWRNVYISCRDEQKKAGKHAATRNPADNGNHDDGKPAA